MLQKKFRLAITLASSAMILLPFFASATAYCCRTVQGGNQQTISGPYNDDDNNRDNGQGECLRGCQDSCQPSCSSGTGAQQCPAIGGTCTTGNTCTAPNTAAVGLCPAGQTCCTAPQQSTVSPGSYQKPSLAIPIPNLQFSDIVSTDLGGGRREISVPYLADYISGVYNYAVGIAAVLAAIMILIGGFQYLTAGDSGRVEEAKERITNAIVGLLLALSTYLILQTINPKTVTLNAIKIYAVKGEPFEYGEGGDGDDPLSTTAYTAPNVYCPKSGGANEIQKIITNLAGKVTYRFNGKGQGPQYSETKQENLQYNSYCPAGNLCLDCSGFVNFVLTCAGMNAPGGGTANIFSNAEKVTKWDPATNSVNGTELKTGDLVGFKAGDNPPGRSVGHVFMYVKGLGFVQSSGQRRAANKPGPATSPDIDAKMVQWVKRVSP